MVIGGIVSAVCQNWQTYLAGRLILGFGNSMAQMCSPILLTEIAHPQHRARFTSVYNTLWNLGAVSMFDSFRSANVPLLMRSQSQP